MYIHRVLHVVINKVDLVSNCDSKRDIKCKHRKIMQSYKHTDPI